MHVHTVFKVTVVSSEDASKGSDEVSVKTAGRRTRSRRRKPKAGGGVAEWSCRTAIYRFGARAQPDRWLRLTFTIADSRTRSSSRSLSLSLSLSSSRRARFSLRRARCIECVHPSVVPLHALLPHAHARAPHSRPLILSFSSSLFALLPRQEKQRRREFTVSHHPRVHSRHTLRIRVLAQPYRDPPAIFSYADRGGGRAP